jgi:hypothetical protein
MSFILRERFPVFINFLNVIMVDFHHFHKVVCGASLDRRLGRPPR